MNLEYFLRNQKYKYETHKDYSYHTDFLGDLEIISDYIVVRDGYISAKAGYAWDGSSIPGKRFMQRITFGKYDPDRYCKEASLVHDAFYQLMRLEHLSRIYKISIDRVYELMCIDGGRRVIIAEAKLKRARIKASNWSGKKKVRKLKSLDKKTDRQLKRLPAWAARRYWAVSKFGHRTLKPRYYPEKQILET